MKGLIKSGVIALFVFVFSFIIIEGDAWATSNFARKYGLSCVTCHSISFPRLNYYGEQFMRNGFQSPDSQDGSDTGKTAITDDLTLAERLGNIMGVRGKIRIFEKQDQTSAGKNIPSTVGSTQAGYIFAAGTIAKNIPVWMEMETATDNGTELHNYFVGWTNIGGSSTANLRVGAFTPTEWTSFSDQKRSLDAPVSHPGVLKPSSFSKTGINPYNLRTTTAIEYYGYTGPAFWALGVADDMGGNYKASSSDDSHKDWYLVLRGDMQSGPAAGSSISFLYYAANFGAANKINGVLNPTREITVYDLSANLRMGPLDVMATYTWDKDVNEGTGEDDDKGFTIEADYKIASNLMGILRYDTFEDGSITTGDSETAYLTSAIVLVPRENIKVTASYTLDLSDDTSLTSSAAGTKFGESNNIIDVQLQFMF